MARFYYGSNVFTKAIERLVWLYQNTEPVLAFSAGKDSGVLLELAIIAARKVGKLPVRVAMRDEEIMYPGTYEYAERCLQRPEIDLKWFIAGQPIVNPFDREMPYWWVFDDRVPNLWVRPRPSWAIKKQQLNIEALIAYKDWGLDTSTDLVSMVGLRVQESAKRAMGATSLSKNEVPFVSGRYKSPAGEDPYSRNAWPIYDWTDSDVWLAIKEMNWDYNRAYDTMLRMGVKKRQMRIGPPTLNGAAIEALTWASRAWPDWWDRVCARIPGIRSAGKFGVIAMQPIRRLGESWETAYKRLCITEAPKWIAERAEIVMNGVLRTHAAHSTTKFPEVAPCEKCSMLPTWKRLTNVMYNGDAFALDTSAYLSAMSPKAFRPDAMEWNGRPSW